MKLFCSKGLSISITCLLTFSNHCREHKTRRAQPQPSNLAKLQLTKLAFNDLPSHSSTWERFAIPNVFLFKILSPRVLLQIDTSKLENRNRPHCSCFSYSEFNLTHCISFSHESRYNSTRLTSTQRHRRLEINSFTPDSPLASIRGCLCSSPSPSPAFVPPLPLFIFCLY